jgi:hypothetical protein
VRNAVLVSATLLAIPLSLLYDMMLGAVAACWLLRGARDAPLPPWEKTVLALSYAAMIDSRGLADQISVPVNTIAALALFAMAARRAWREMGFRAFSRDPALLRPGAATPTK